MTDWLSYFLQASQGCSTVIEWLDVLFEEEIGMTNGFLGSTDPAHATLSDVLNGNQEGYRLTIGYSLALTHSLMGCFPAVFKEDPKRIVVVLEPDLLKKVWETLPKRRAAINRHLLYVNEQGARAFPVRAGHSLEDIEQHGSWLVLTHHEFEDCLTRDAASFVWAAGLVSDDMTSEEFLRTLQESLARVGAA